jgi:hypothetical protein
VFVCLLMKFCVCWIEKYLIKIESLMFCKFFTICGVLFLDRFRFSLLKF